MEDTFALELVRDEAERWTFSVPGNCNQNGLVNFCGKLKKFEPEEIFDMILERLKQTAENYLEKPLTKAVISVTAYFNNLQRQTTIDAEKIADLEVLGIINKPTAAALCYGIEKSSGQENKRVVVFELGGGTFDVSVVSIEDGMFTVRSTTGNCHLCENDFDNCVDKLKTQHELNPSTDNVLLCAMQQTKPECESAKARLSTSKQTSISVEYRFSQSQFSLLISQTQFEDLCKPYLARPMKMEDNQEVAVEIDQNDVGKQYNCPTFSEILKNQAVFHHLQQANIADNQEVAGVVDQNGVGKQYYCLSDTEIRKKQAMLHQLQLEEQQYREMLVHKNHLEKVMSTIKSQLESIHSVIRPDLLQKMQTRLNNLKQMFINQDTCQYYPKKLNPTKEEIVKRQANLVRLYKMVIHQQFVQPIDSIIENQMHHHN